jgi:hypothetical protein
MLSITSPQDAGSNLSASNLIRPFSILKAFGGYLKNTRLEMARKMYPNKTYGHGRRRLGLNSSLLKRFFFLFPGAAVN